MISDQLNHSRYEIRKKALRIFGGAFRICDPNGDVVLYAQTKSTLFKKDIRLYSDKKKRTEVLAIKARQRGVFSPIYDVIDGATHQRIGVLQRKGLKSLLQTEWLLLDAQDQEIGRITEDRRLAVDRRLDEQGGTPFLAYAEMSGKTVCTFTQKPRLFFKGITVNFLDRSGLLDRRLGLAAALLLY